MIAIIQLPFKIKIDGICGIYEPDKCNCLFEPVAFEITHEVQDNGRYFTVSVVPIDSNGVRFDTIKFTADYKTLSDIYSDPRSFIISAFEKFSDDIDEYCYENHRTYTIDDLPEGISLAMLCVPGGKEAETYFYHEDDKEFTNEEIDVIEKYMQGHPYKLSTKDEARKIMEEAE